MILLGSINLIHTIMTFFSILQFLIYMHIAEYRLNIFKCSVKNNDVKPSS